MWKQDIYPSQVIEPSSILCFTAKWLGEPEVEWRGRKPDGHKRMIRRAWKLLNEADAVVHYNGKRFDVPRLQREFLKLDMSPPAPFAQIDLLATARRKFSFDSNKLERVADELGIGRKEEHEGFRLWIKCLDGDLNAWERMRRYNVKDVRLTERLYVEKLRPWISGHPSIAAHHGVDCCTRCGGQALQRRGYATLRTGRYPRLKCLTCKAWMRSTKRYDSTEIVEIPL